MVWRLWLRTRKLSGATENRLPAGINDLTVNTPVDTVRIHLPGNAEQVYFVKNGKDTIDLGFTIENVFFKSTNGDTINGWLLKPKKQPAQITLLHMHGNGDFMFNHYNDISPLVKRGFQVFMFDYSGFGKSSGKATRDNVLISALPALDYVKTREDVKTTKLVIYGQSLGAHYATVVASMREKDIDRGEAC